MHFLLQCHIQCDIDWNRRNIHHNGEVVDIYHTNNEQKQDYSIVVLMILQKKRNPAVKLDDAVQRVFFSHMFRCQDAGRSHIMVNTPRTVRCWHVR